MPALIIMGIGLGNIFAPGFATATYGVAPEDSGVASAMVNTMQQVGGSIGLALLGTVAWTVVSNSIHAQVKAAAAASVQAGQPGHAAAPAASPPLRRRRARLRRRRGSRFAAPWWR